MTTPESSHSLVITYTADGRMFMQFGRAEPPRLVAGDWLGAMPEEIVAAASDFYSYCGTYDYLDGGVLHHIKVSLMSNWIGGAQRRFVRFDSDGLTLSTPPIQFAGWQQIVTIVWQVV